MTIYSSAKVYDRIDAAISGLVKCSYFDSCDRCMIVNVKCWVCGEVYSEELEEAKLKVAVGEDFFCIDHDEEAVLPELIRVLEV